MKTATTIEAQIELTVVCPHCGTENYFFNSDLLPSFFPDGGVVTCDFSDCEEEFMVPSFVFVEGKLRPDTAG